MGKKYLIAGSALVVLVCIAGAAGGALGISAALVGLWSLLIYCADYRSHASEKSGFRYHLADAAVPYLIPVIVGTAFYLLLSAYVTIFGDGLGYGWLLSLQHTFENVSTFFSGELKLSPFGVLVVMIALYLINGRLAATRPSAVVALDTAFARYRKYSGPIGAGLATLAAFTFFGLQLGNISHDLQLRVKIVQAGYADVVAQARQEVSEHVAADLYQKVDNAFPASYRGAVEHVQDVDAAWSSASQHAQTAGYEQVRDPDVDALLDKEGSRENAVARLDDQPTAETGAPPSAPDGDLTVDGVKAAQEKIHARQQKAIDVVTEGPKKITLHLESLVSAKVLEVLKPLTTDIPITGPLVQAFSKAIDKNLQEKLERLYDRARGTSVHDPAHLDALIDREATALVAQTDVGPVVHAQEPAAAQQVQAQADLITQLGDGSTKLDQAVAASEAAAAAEAAKDPSPRLKLTDPFPLPLDLPPPTYYGYNYENTYPYTEPDLHPYTPPEFEGGGYEPPPVFEEPPIEIPFF